MLPSHTVMSVITTALLLVGGTSALTPSEQSTKQEAPVSATTPSVGKWGNFLGRDPEIETLQSEPRLTHAQTVWVYALEWCESRGVPEAVNEVDRDGTPSFYSFQFKPSTFRYYGERFGVIRGGLTDTEIFDLMKSRENQFRVVEQMLLHYDEITWTKQFPDCVNRYIGMPPRY